MFDSLQHCNIASLKLGFEQLLCCGRLFVVHPVCHLTVPIDLLASGFVTAMYCQWFVARVAQMLRNDLSDQCQIDLRVDLSARLGQISK